MTSFPVQLVISVSFFDNELAMKEQVNKLNTPVPLKADPTLNQETIQLVYSMTPLVRFGGNVVNFHSFW